jgi:hypothetical protein
MVEIVGVYRNALDSMGSFAEEKNMAPNEFPLNAISFAELSSSAVPTGNEPADRKYFLKSKSF